MNSQTPIFPLCYLGSVAYYAAMLKHGNVLLERFEHYPKQTVRNRSEIYGANGGLTISIPIQRKGERIPVSKAAISNADRWQKLHWRSLESAYRSSPYFEFYEDELAPYFNEPASNFWSFTEALHRQIISWLQVDLPVAYTDHFVKDNPSGVEYRVFFDRVFPANAFPAYQQVFQSKHGFLPNLSIVDLLFNEGPNACNYLRKVIERLQKSDHL